MAVDINGALSCLPSLSAIPQATLSRYRQDLLENRDAAFVEMARRLGVTYIVDGTIRKIYQEICFTAELISVDSLVRRSLWGPCRYLYDPDRVKTRTPGPRFMNFSRFLAFSAITGPAERKNSLQMRRFQTISEFSHGLDPDQTYGIFERLSEIAEKIATAVIPTISEADREQARRIPYGRRRAWHAYQVGLILLAQGTRQDLALAKESFEEAKRLDPDFAGGYRGLALVCVHEGITFAKGYDPKALNEAVNCGKEALRRAPGDPEMLSCVGNALGVQGRHDMALQYAGLARDKAPNFAAAYGVQGAALTFSGNPHAALGSLSKCISLDPGEAMSQTRLLQIAVAHYFCKDYDATVKVAEQVIARHPHPLAYKWLAAAHGQLGATADAHAALQAAQALDPEAYKSWDKRPPWMRTEDFAHLLQGLRNAGWKTDMVATTSVATSFDAA